jgi:flagellar hook-length control protein FliK
MSAMPDLRLQATPEVKSKAKPPAKAPEPSKNEASSFAEVYAKERQAKPGEEPGLELPLDDLAKDALDSLKDSVQPNRPDQFVSKLNALTQAFNQQTGAAPRLPLVPGQPVAMQQGGWSEAVVDRVMWLSSQNLKSAEIQLDPAELGRLEVRVNLSQDQAQVTFASPNAGVREALEGQMQRLRELFAQQGMNLADANVSDQSLSRGWQGQGEGGRGGASGGDGRLASDESLPSAAQELRSERSSAGLGLVDYYA